MSKMPVSEPLTLITKTVQNQLDIGKAKPGVLATPTKKLLIIRPRIWSDPLTRGFSFNAAWPIKNKADDEGWAVMDLQERDTNPDNVAAVIKSYNPDFIVHYDHGEVFALMGQAEDDSFVAAIDASSVSLLSGRTVATVSCLSAKGLGPLAVQFAEPSRAYLGYDDLCYVNWKYVVAFEDALNAAPLALLEGKTFEEAYYIAYQVHTEKFNEIVSEDPVAAALMLSNRDHLTRLGDPYEKAYTVLPTPPANAPEIYILSVATKGFISLGNEKKEKIVDLASSYKAGTALTFNGMIVPREEIESFHVFSSLKAFHKLILPNGKTPSEEKSRYILDCLVKGAVLGVSDVTSDFA